MSDDPKEQQQPKDQEQAPAWVAGLERLIGKNGGDSSRVAELLYQENYQHRQRIRELEGKAVPEGAVILTGDAKAAYEAYTALGKPDELSTRLSAFDALQQRTTALEREQRVNQAATAHGIKASVLGKLPGFDKPLEIKEVEGKPVAFVKDGESETALPDYLQANYSDFLPALQAEASQQRSGTAYPPQASSGKAPARSAGQQHIVKTKYALPGPERTRQQE